MRTRLLVLLQSVLIVSWLVLPAAGLAADPSPAPEPPTPAPSSAPSTEPAAEPTVEPSAAPPAVEPSTQPSPATLPEAGSPEPSPEASPVVEPSNAPSPAPLDPETPVGTDDYVVTFASDLTGAVRQGILADAGADVVETIPALRMAFVRVPAGSTVVAALNGDPGVLRVERDRVRSVDATTDDPAYEDQWSLPRIGWNDVFGTIQPTGTSVVAVLDTGVDAGHADLGGRLVAGTSTLPGGDPTVDPNGHGTAMAGIIAASTDNAEGIAGIGFAGVRVMPVTVLDAEGLGQDSDIIEGIVWAVDHGADVLNLSFSNPGYSAALQAAIDYAWDHDVVVVAATGNDGSSAPTYPAGDRGVVGVSNTNRDDQLDGSSNFGAGAFLGAPGVDIVTLRAGGGTTSISGTSASSAAVAGAAGLLRAIDPDADNGVIVGRLARTAAAVGTRAETGNGRLDLARAATDHGTSAVRPSGAGTTGGGPFVGPYVAANATINPGATTLNGSTGRINVAAGSSITLVMNVTTTNPGTGPNWNASRWALATAPPAPGTLPCINHPNHAGPGTFSETITITAPPTAGTYNLYLWAYNGDTCPAAGQSAMFTRTAALDQVAPTVTINQAAGQVDPTGASPITFTVVFSEAVAGFTAADVTLGGTVGGTLAAAVSGAGPTYTVSVTGMSGGGTVTASVVASAATDPAGNASAASTSTDNTVTFDGVAPTVTINQAVGQVDPDNTSPIIFTVVFSETVTGFASNDVTITGTAGGTKAVAISGTGPTYTATVTGMTTSGTVIATIAPNRVLDLLGNNNLASTSTDNTVTWDVTVPTVTVNQAVGQVDPDNTSPIIFTVVFSETVTGFTNTDVAIGGTAGGTKLVAISGTGPTYTATVTGMTTSGTVIATIAANQVQDLAGNNNTVATFTDNSVTWDVTVPTVTINQAAGQVDPTGASPITFTVVFSEAVAGFTAADVTLGGTVGGTLAAAVSGAGPTYTVSVTGMSGGGTVTASVVASAATDPAGNASAASTSTDNTVTFDGVAPTVTVNQAVGQVDPDNTSPIIFTVVFSETVTGFASNDVTITGTAGGTKAVAISGTGPTYTATVTGMTTSGTVIATIAAEPGARSPGQQQPRLDLDRQHRHLGRHRPDRDRQPGRRPGRPRQHQPDHLHRRLQRDRHRLHQHRRRDQRDRRRDQARRDQRDRADVHRDRHRDDDLGHGHRHDRREPGPGSRRQQQHRRDLHRQQRHLGRHRPDRHDQPGRRPGRPDRRQPDHVHGRLQRGRGRLHRGRRDPRRDGRRDARRRGLGSRSDVHRQRHRDERRGHGHRVGRRLGRDRPGRQRQRRLDLDRQHGHLRRRRADGHGQPGRRPGRPRQHQPDHLHRRLQRDRHRLRQQRRHDHRHCRRDQGRRDQRDRADLHRHGHRDDDLGHGHRHDRPEPGGRSPGQQQPRLDLDRQHRHLGRHRPDRDGQPGRRPGRPDNTSPIIFTVVFSETVTGFTNTDVAISGTAGGTKLVAISGTGPTYTATVTGMTTSGTVIATIAANQVQDLAGNNNTVATFTDNSVTWDRATQLGFVQQPTDTVYLSTITPAVTVAILDVNGFVVTEKSATISVVLTPAGPTLGGTVSVAAINGVATFPGLTVDQVGTYQLVASSVGLTDATSASFNITPAPLTITADDRTKTYGQTVTFAGTEFTTSGLLGSDSVTSVSLASPGAVATATVAGSPHLITPSAAIGTGLANYAISYVAGDLTINPATAAIAVTGYSVTYDAAAHTATGTATGVLGEDLSADLDLSATTHTAAGTYVDPWTFTDPAGNYTTASGTVGNQIDQAPLTITAERPDEGLRPDGRLRRNRVHDERPARDRHRDERHASTSPGAAADRDGRRLALRDHAERGCRHRGLQLRDQLRRWIAHRHACRADDHGRRPDQDVRPDGRLRRDRVHDERPGQRRHGDSVTLTSSGAVATATVAGCALRDHAVGGRRDRAGELHDHLCRWRPGRHPGAADDHGRRPNEDVRRDGRLRRDRVHDERPRERRRGDERHADQRRGARLGDRRRLARTRSRRAQPSARASRTTRSPMSMATWTSRRRR